MRIFEKETNKLWNVDILKVMITRRAKKLVAISEQEIVCHYTEWSCDSWGSRESPAWVVFTNCRSK